MTQDKQGLVITCKKPLPRHETVSDKEYQEKLKNKHRNQGEENLDYKLEASSTSCNFSDIKGIIYGGISSRFWMLRKHMIQMDTQKFVNGMVPFYAWECVTLCLEQREVDLVIQNDRDMDDLIKLIVRGMKTVDGNKDSIQVVQKKILKIKKRDAGGAFCKADFDDDGNPVIQEKEQYSILRSTCFKYKLMRIRCKISYQAFICNKTIPELLMSQILNTYDDLVFLNEIKQSYQ